MTGIAWNENVTGPVTSITQLFEDPKLKGKVTALNDMADTMGLVMLDNGDDPAKVTDATWNERHRPDPERRRLGPDPAVHRQRLRPAADQGRPRRRDRLVGGHLPAALLATTKLQWAAPDEGRGDLDGQHDHPDGRELRDRVDLHELRVRPEDRRADRRLRRVRAARQGHPGGDAEDRSGAGEEPARVPDGRDLAKTHQFDPAAQNNETYIEQWQKVLGAREAGQVAGRGDELPSALTRGSRPTSSCCRGSSGSACSSSPRWASSATSRSSRGRSTRGTPSTGRSRTTGTRCRPTTSSSSAPSSMPASRRCSPSRSPIRSSTGSRSGPDGGRTCSSS